MPKQTNKFLTLSPSRDQTRLYLRAIARHGELMFEAGRSYNSLESAEPLALDVMQAGWLRQQLKDFKQQQKGERSEALASRRQN